MKRHRIDRHKSRSIFAIGFVSVAVVGLSLHGCVRSPQEFLAGLRGQRSENPGMVPPSESGRGQQLAEGADPWAHSASETAIQQVDYQTESNAAIDNTKAATPNGPGEENRLASILQQRRQEQNQRIAAEPRPAAPNHSRDFVPTAATPQLPRNSAAAGQRSTMADSSSNRFANGFETRMAEIRRDLNSREQRSTELVSAESGLSGLPVWAQPRTAQPAAIAESTPQKMTSQVQAMTSQVQAGDDPFGHPVITPRDGTRAVTPAAAASETASLSADPRSEQSEDWAIEPASANEPAADDDSDARLASWLHRHDERSEPAGSSSSFVEQTVAYSAEPLVSSGGVTLLPPVVDDRSFELSEDIFGRPDSAAGDRKSTAEAIASIERPERVDFSDLLRTWDESEPQPSSHTRTRTESLRPLPPLSSIDKAVLTDTDRPSISDPANWPQFTSPTEQLTGREPIRVAMAPPLSTDSTTSLAAGGSGSPAGRSTQSGANNAESGSGWFRQLPWLIGGVILLIIAIRLTARRPEKT